jgi:hypothetical protein
MLTLLEQQLASVAEPAEPFMSEQHSLKCSWNVRGRNHEEHEGH